MRAVCYLAGIAALGIGVLILADAQFVTHQMFGGLAIVVSAICFVGGFVITAIESATVQICAAARIRPAPLAGPTDSPVLPSRPSRLARRLGS